VKKTKGMVLEMPEYFTHEELVNEFGRQIKDRINHRNDDTMRFIEESPRNHNNEENASADEKETQTSTQLLEDIFLKGAKTDRAPI